MITDYIFQLGLPLLEKKGNNWNFRCVVCGDSRKNPNKKRGWILTDKNQYYCHNCGYSSTFPYFLKKFYYSIYLEYLKDNLKNKKKYHVKKPKIIHHKKNIFPIQNYKSVLQLNKNHKCYKYIKERKIPFKYFKLLYYCENFKKEINKIYPEKFKNYPEFDERLIIPFFDKQNNISYIQGRTLNNDFLRYITINFISDTPKIFGLDRIELNKLIYVVEGPIDSLFLDNAIAMAAASININDLLSISNKSNFIFIFDLENRNKEICQQIEKIINMNFKICLFPESLKKYGKDINEFIINGLTMKKIYNIIQKNTFLGLQAKIRFKLWKKT